MESLPIGQIQDVSVVQRGREPVGFHLLEKMSLFSLFKGLNVSLLDTVFFPGA